MQVPARGKAPSPQPVVRKGTVLMVVTVTPWLPDPRAACVRPSDRLSLDSVHLIAASALGGPDCSGHESPSSCLWVLPQWISMVSVHQ